MQRYNKKYYSSPFANNLVSPRRVRPEPKRQQQEPTLARKITIYEYLANNVPSDCHFLINKYDSYRKARDSKHISPL